MEENQKNIQEQEAKTEEVQEEAVEQEASDPEALEQEASEPEEAAEEAKEPKEASEEEQEAAEPEKKKSPFKKKEKKDKAAEQIAELNDKVKRQMAEFDNFRKRTEREKSQMFEIGARSVIEKILPVIDNFERGLAAVPEEGREDGFVQGMDKIYKQLMTELEGLGVKPIEAVGKEFDPDYHNAVMQVENEELESGTVAQELLKGYMYRESVVRHSMVAVVQ